MLPYYFIISRPLVSSMNLQLSTISILYTNLIWPASVFISRCDISVLFSVSLSLAPHVLIGMIVHHKAGEENRGRIGHIDALGTPFCLELFGQRSEI